MTAPIPKPKPCPFCGKPPTIRKVVDSEFWFVECVKAKSEDCPAFAYTGATSEAEAVRLWNRRAKA